MKLNPKILNIIYIFSRDLERIEIPNINTRMFLPMRNLSYMYVWISIKEWRREQSEICQMLSCKLSNVSLQCVFMQEKSLCWELFNFVTFGPCQIEFNIMMCRHDVTSLWKHDVYPIEAQSLDQGTRMPHITQDEVTG